MSSTKGKTSSFLERLGKKIEENLKERYSTFTWYPDPKKRGTWGFISDCINTGLLLLMVYLMLFKIRPEMNECKENVEAYYNKLFWKQKYSMDWDMNESNGTLFSLNGSGNNCRVVCDGGVGVVGGN